MSLSSVFLEDYIRELKDALSSATDDASLFNTIVNAPFSNRRMTTTFGLGFLTFVMVNKKKRTIDRITMSQTDMAQGARDVTVIPFEKLIVPINYKGNAVVEAIRTGRYQQTNDWNYLLTPVLKPEEARLNQAGAAIASSYVYPLNNARDGGAIIFQYFVTLDKIGSEHRDFMFRYTKLVSQVLNNIK